MPKGSCSNRRFLLSSRLTYGLARFQGVLSCKFLSIRDVLSGLSENSGFCLEAQGGSHILRTGKERPKTCGNLGHEIS